MSTLARAALQRLPTHHTDFHTVHKMKFAAGRGLVAASLIASASAQIILESSLTTGGGLATGDETASVMIGNAVVANRAVIS